MDGEKTRAEEEEEAKVAARSGLGADASRGQYYQNAYAAEIAANQEEKNTG